MPFPHRLVITRPGEGGAQDRETGAWVPAPPLTLYDGGADVQDEGAELKRSVDNTPTLTSDATAYLEDESRIGRIQPDDDVRVVWDDEDGSESLGQVVRARRLDGAVLLRWLS